MTTTAYRDIFEYEIVLKLTNKNTRAVSLVTRVEHAYSLPDAVMQACANQGAEMVTGSATIELQKIGPPSEAIRLAAVRVATQVAEGMKAIEEAAKLKASTP